MPADSTILRGILILLEGPAASCCDGTRRRFAITTVTPHVRRAVAEYAFVDGAASLNRTRRCRRPLAARNLRRAAADSACWSGRRHGHGSSRLNGR